MTDFTKNTKKALEDALIDLYLTIKVRKDGDVIFMLSKGRNIQ